MTDHPSAYDDLRDTPHPAVPPTIPGDASPSPSASDRASSEAVPSSPTDTAKHEVSRVAGNAAAAAGDVVATAKDEAANLAAETKQQAKSLLSTAGDELKSQTGAQQQRVAAGVRSLVDELGAMVSGTDQSGPLTDLAQQAADKGRALAQWLEDHEPQDVLREVQTFARRRPVAFLAICGLAGVIAGRITRGAVAAQSDDAAGQQNPSASGTSGSGAAYRTERPGSYGTGSAQPSSYGQGAARPSESFDKPL